MVEILAGSSILYSVQAWGRRAPLAHNSRRDNGVHLIKGELTDELAARQAKREAEVVRILWNMQEAFTEAELARPEAQAIINWLTLRDTWNQEMPRYRANPGEPVEAFEERIRIALELQDTFPQYRVGTCANIWLWLMLGANGRDTTEGKPSTSSPD